VGREDFVGMTEDGTVVDAVEVIAHKVDVIGYLTPTNFTIRAAIYFAIWAGVAPLASPTRRSRSRRRSEAMRPGQS